MAFLLPIQNEMMDFDQTYSYIANSVDPDQTAPREQSDLGFNCLHKSVCQALRCSKL